MKNSCYSRVVALLSLTTAIGVMVAAAAIGQTQGRRSRDRSNRVARSAEPNTAARNVGGAVTTSATAPQDGLAAYDIIRQRNIFSRQRIPPRPAGEREAKPVVAPDPETFFLLRGIVQENSEFIAFIEDTQTGRVVRLRQNDSVARGVVKSLSLDSIEYQLGDKTIPVKIGFDLEGGHGTTVAGGTLDWPQNSAPAAQPAPTGQPQTPSSNEADILKRLMEQRRQQLGQ
jgi:hypothetical protein